MPQPIDPPAPDHLEPIRLHAEREAAWLDRLHTRLIAHGLLPLHPLCKNVRKAQRAMRDLESDFRYCIRDGVRPNQASVAERRGS